MDPLPTTDPEPSSLRPFRIPPLTTHIVRFAIFVVMVGFGVHLLLPQLAGLEAAWDTVIDMPGALVAAAVLAEVMSYVGIGLMMHNLSDLVGDWLAIWRGTIIGTAAASVGLVAGGTVGNSAITYRWVRGSGVRRLGAALCATVPLLLIHLILLLISIVGLVSLLLIHQLTAIEVISFAMLLIILASIMGIALWGMIRPNRLIERATPIMRRYHEWRGHTFDPQDVVDYVNQLVDTGVVLRQGWHGPAFGAIVNIGFDMLALYILFYATGVTLTPSTLLAGYGLPLLVGRLPIVPGGVGLVETTMSAIFISLGVPRDSTVVATLAFRLVSFWLPTLSGFPLAAYLQHVTSRSPVSSSSETSPSAPNGSEVDPFAAGG